MTHQQNIAAKLLDYGIMINNAISDSEIAATILPFGYSAEALTQAKNLLAEADGLVKSQIKEYGEQYEASQTMRNLWETANKAYTKALLIARICFKENTGAQAALLLNGRRKKTLSGWLQQTQSFYNNLELDSNFMTAMAAYGYTAEKIAAEKALIAQLETAKHTQAKEKGEAQQATNDRDKKMDDLDEWISDFRVIAKIALEENAQWLEKLGILERS